MAATDRTQPAEEAMAAHSPADAGPRARSPQTMDRRDLIRRLVRGGAGALAAAIGAQDLTTALALARPTSGATARMTNRSS